MTFRQALFWAPRVLAIMFIAFVSLFALDVFNEGYDFWRTLLALIIHLAPSLVLLAALALTWRWEWVGTVAFTLCGAYLSVIARGTMAKAVFAVPCFAAAWLFFVNWKLRRFDSRRPN